jgi:hypothetical protein
MEIWKDYKDYQVSNHGNVKGKKGQLLNPSTTHDGYKYVPIYDNGKKIMKVHRLVLLVFVGECPLGKECDHIDRNRANNRLENLKWVTPKENSMNKSTTRTDITETDQRLRKNILQKESNLKRNRAKGMKPKSVGCITKTSSDKFIGSININFKRYSSKSLATRDEAQHFINQSVAFDWLKSLGEKAKTSQNE